MKQIISVLIMLSIISIAFSQPCLPEGIQFMTQEEVDNFQANYPGCTEIEGDLIIGKQEETWIFDLNGLNCLTSVGGSLLIQSLVYLTSSNLEGLNNLTSIGGSLEIHECDGLTSLEGLENLETIGGELIIQYNSYISSLETLSNITSPLNGLLRIKYNGDLVDLSGLDNIPSINGNLEIHGNNDLKSLTGIENIDPASINNLAIIGNDSLSVCEIPNICNYLENINGKIIIFNNNVGCNDPIELASNCGISLSCLPYGNYYFQSQESIDNFHNNYNGCTTLSGSTSISGDDIENLSGLSLIDHVDGSISIIGNPNLTTLQGLNNIDTITGKLGISLNTGLNSLNGLNNLEIIGGKLLLDENGVLYNLTGLDNLTSIGEDLQIIGNYNLYDLSGMDNLEYVHESLQIWGNNNLSDCDYGYICEYVLNQYGYINIHDNLPGCNNQAEVIESCLTSINFNNTTDQKYEIYPNPTHKWINIETVNNTSPYNLEIRNLMGKLVKEEQNIQSSHTAMNIADLRSGIYFYNIKENEIVVQKGKIMMQ